MGISTSDAQLRGQDPKHRWPSPSSTPIGSFKMLSKAMVGVDERASGPKEPRWVRHPTSTLTTAGHHEDIWGFLLFPGFIEGRINSSVLHCFSCHNRSGTVFTRAFCVRLKFLPSSCCFPPQTTCYLEDLSWCWSLFACIFVWHLSAACLNS